MATLERGRSAERAQYVGDKLTDPSQSAIPTPFPAAQVAQYSESRTDSRSPSGTRRASLSRGVGGMIDKVKRAMSASRERSTSGGEGYRAGSRGRRESVDTNFTDEPRGRTGLTTIPSLTDGHTLHATTTRSTSRGRAVLSTGRGGAGNMKGVEEAGEADGEEPEEVMKAAREEVERERSESRERKGRDEMVGSGRGGRGNIRSTSRGRELDLGRVPTVQEEQERVQVLDELERERQVLEAHLKNAENHRTYSTGRGGAGNIRGASKTR